MIHKIQRYGWIPDLPDQRDHVYAAPVVKPGVLPASVDLTRKCPAVYDQGQLGSCTGNAIAGAIQFDKLKQRLDGASVPSRLFIYFNERVIEGTVNSDSGAQIRDGIKAVAKLGVCGESLWPYDVEKFRVKPPKPCYLEAAKHTALDYQRLVQSPGQMKGCLAAGYPFVFGFTVYESFEGSAVAKTGTVPMPGPGEKVLGGHAVLAVGYSDRTERFIVRNSWGPDWGRKGYFTIPYAYLAESNLAADFWTIRLVR
jgi:C1A family cysteine protease